MFGDGNEGWLVLRDEIPIESGGAAALSLSYADDFGLFTNFR